MKQVDPKLAPIISALLEQGATPKALMEAALALTELAGDLLADAFVDGDDSIEYLDLDAIQDPITEFLSNLNEKESN